MRAVCIKDGTGPASSLYIGTQPVPVFHSTPLADGAGPEVLVKVKAFGLNRADVLQREGKYPVPSGAPDVLGLEFSGVVEAIGPTLHDDDRAAQQPEAHTYRPQVGDEVFGLALGGAYAEYIKVRSSLLLPKPQALSWVTAAAIPETWFTAFQALRTIADLRPASEWDQQAIHERRLVLGLNSIPGDPTADANQVAKDVLIHAGASGVGLAAIQVARDLGARNVYVTAGSDTKIEACKSVGAKAGWNYKAQDWAEGLASLHGLDGKSAKKKGCVDIIVDFVGGDYWNKNLASLRPDGRMVMLATMGGPYVKTPKGADILSLVYKRLRVEGSTLRHRSLSYQGRVIQGFLRAGIMDRIVAGTAEGSQTPQHTVLLHKVASWKDIPALHREMEANSNIGKMVALVD